MTHPIDCRVFEDQLDALVRGELPEDGAAQLRHHAGQCESCGMLLRVQDHLRSPSLEALETEVPEGSVTSMWTRVQGALDALPPTTGARPSGAPGRAARKAWRAPALAATTVALLFSTGFLFRALQRVEGRERTLVRQVLDQQRRLTGLETPPERRSGRGVGFAARGPLLRRLANRQEGLTVEGLRTLLAALPGGTTLFSASRMNTLPRPGASLVPSVWREALARLEGSDLVTARDLLRILDDLDLPAGVSVPTSRLIGLLD